MKVISHRGNLIGKNPEQENHPSYISDAVAKGFDVEVDVWVQGGKFVLGHDSPQYDVSVGFLQGLPLWCHAKNEEALERLLWGNLHCFWHENDKMTLTSKGIPWCYPENYMQLGVTVMQDESVPKKKIFGICTDYALKIRGDIV
jgi:hypothetical protein